ncbi:MAG: polyprenyl synthetase family protein [Limnochordia bacterium]
MDYIGSTSGKRLRPLLVLLTFDLCGGTRFQEAIDCAAGVELVHMASLIHDDIIDRSQLRRGQLTAHCRFGTQAAVLAGDHLFAAAFHLFALGTGQRVSRVMTTVIQDMCAGEIHQLLSPVTEEEDYLDYIQKKTACLFGGCCRLGAILSDLDDAEGAHLQEFGESLGLAFQLIDDVWDYRGRKEDTGKERGRDFAQGLWTLPTIRALRRGLIPHNWQSLGFASICNLMEENGLFDEVLQMAANYVQKAKLILGRSPNSMAKAELEGLADQILAQYF